MASNTDVTCAATSETLVFSGVGQVVLSPQSGGSYYYGGHGVTDTTGTFLTTPSVALYITSPDKIYVYNTSGSVGVVRIYHNR